jgi:hypothetical protein
MNKVSRTLLLAGVLAFGTLSAACGDKVTVAGPGGAQGVQLVTVTPPSATVAVGQSIILSGQVTADAASAKTVTWSTSNAAVATVDATGKVTGVSAGTVSITATSTADASKAASSAVTVTGGAVSTPNLVAISAVTQGGAPVQLNNVNGQVDVTLFVSGPSGTLQLIQNCTAGGATSTTGDVVVAQQVVAGSQDQTPVTLSYNTAATGTVVAGVATPSNTSSTPIFNNGNCVLKAKLGTALATQLTPITLTNANRFNSTVTFAKTTTLGTQNAISAANGLRYDQGDLTVSVTPVIYSGQTPALVSISYAGRIFTNVAPTTGTSNFSVTFPSTAASAAAAATAAVSIYQYTSPSTGDNVVVTAASDVAGQTINYGSGIAAAGLRSDNASPVLTGPLAQNLNLNGAPRNYINAAYAFLANNTTQTDAAFPTSQFIRTFYVGALPATVPAYPTAQSTNSASTACSVTGLTQATTGADVAQTGAPFAPGYFVRVIEADPLGNQICQDFGPFGVDKQNPNAVVQTAGAADQSVVAAGSGVSFNSADSVSGFTPGAELRVRSLFNFTANSAASCAVGTFASSNCGFAANSFNVASVTGASTAQGYYQVETFAQDQAGNNSTTIIRTYLVDNTAPTVGGVSIPQALVGGAAVTFTSQANDNVDLKASNFSVTYSATSGTPSLYYAGDNYGPNFDATRVTSSALNATVPFFIKQLQGTAAGAPVAFAPGDSGKAASVTVRAVDAANLVSAPVAAAIPPINIASSAGFTAAQLSTFSDVTPAPATALSNGTGTAARTTGLAAAAVLNSATAQQANQPFSQVCFFYQQTTANPLIPLNDLVQIGCVSAAEITDVANVSRTWTYRFPNFDPAADLGTAGTVTIYAIGINAAGVGIISGPGNTITLQN